MNWLYINIYGSLTDKLQNVDFIEFITKYDIIFLSECWISEKFSNTRNNPNEKEYLFRPINDRKYFWKEEHNAKFQNVMNEEFPTTHLSSIIDILNNKENDIDNELLEECILALNNILDYAAQPFVSSKKYSPVIDQPTKKITINGMTLSADI